MNKLLFLLIFIPFACTEKENKTCWTCTFTQNVNGQTLPPQDICNDGQTPTPDYTDDQGNEYGYECKKK